MGTPVAQGKSRDDVMLEIRQSQKKLARAKGRGDQSTVRYQKAHIELLRKELARLM